MSGLDMSRDIAWAEQRARELTSDEGTDILCEEIAKTGGWLEHWNQDYIPAGSGMVQILRMRIASHLSNWDSYPDQWSKEARAIAARLGVPPMVDENDNELPFAHLTPEDQSRLLSAAQSVAKAWGI